MRRWNELQIHIAMVVFALGAACTERILEIKPLLRNNLVEEPITLESIPGEEIGRIKQYGDEIFAIDFGTKSIVSLETSQLIPRIDTTIFPLPSGKGPGEVLAITDFSMIGGYWLILDGTQRKVILFSLDKKQLIAELSLKYLPNNIAVLDNKSFILTYVDRLLSAEIFQIDNPNRNAVEINSKMQLQTKTLFQSPETIHPFALVNTAVITDRKLFLVSTHLPIVFQVDNQLNVVKRIPLASNSPQEEFNSTNLSRFASEYTSTDLPIFNSNVIYNASTNIFLITSAEQRPKKIRFLDIYDSNFSYKQSYEMTEFSIIQYSYDTIMVVDVLKFGETRAISLN